jgi:putative cardiolipin synthase
MMPHRLLLSVLGVAFVLLAGCAGIRQDHAVVPAQAFDRPLETMLGRAHAAGEQRHAGQSGFRLLNNGVSALLTRAALIDAAERSIDLQYFIFDADDTGFFLLERLLAAADRGVRVRILLDDYLIGFDDVTLSRIDAHANVEVRVFNPYPDRLWPRALQLMMRPSRLGHRMHNKIFVVDGQMGVVGGRNIGNHYFEGESESNFRDADMLATGPVVREAAAIFDSFWNSPMVVPVAAFGVSPSATTNDALAAWRATTADFGSHQEYRRRQAEFRQRVLSGEGLIWAPARAVGEPPIRQAEGAAKSSAEVARVHAIARQKAQREITYAVAYFVPGERGVEVLCQVAARGVRVRVLTNSLAATDVVPVHSGYAPYREALLAGGVELYEYRHDAPRPTPAAGHRLRKGRSESALHAKVAVYDRQRLWIGSANFDPRSRHLNTEAGVMIESEALAGQVLATLERDLDATHSWRLTLDPEKPAGQRLVWNGLRKGQPWRGTSEPDASAWRRFSSGFYRLLGIESLL